MTDHTKRLAVVVQTLIPAATIAIEMLRCLEDERAVVIERAVGLAQKFLDEYHADHPGESS